jgi:hypothetical protein
MGTGRIGVIDITAVTMVADTTAGVIMADGTIEGVTMADVPTIIIIGTIDSFLISQRKGPKKIEDFSWVVSRTRANVLEWWIADRSNQLSNFVSNAPLFVSLRD